MRRDPIPAPKCWNRTQAAKPPPGCFGQTGWVVTAPLSGIGNPSPWMEAWFFAVCLCSGLTFGLLTLLHVLVIAL